MVKVNGLKVMPSVNTNNNIAIAILTGGASSRMGQDKAGLKLPDNQPLLEYMFKKYSEYMVFSSGKSGNNISQHYKGVPDIFTTRLGPVAGIISSIMWLANSHPQIKQCIFVPVDLPCLSKEDLSMMVEAQYEVAYFKDNPLPLKIKISSEASKVCQNIIAEINLLGGYSVYKFIQQFKSRIELISITSQSLININYIEDWERFVNEYMSK